MDTRDRSLPCTIPNAALQDYAVRLRRVSGQIAAHRAVLRVKQQTKFLNAQPFEAIVNGEACGYFSNAPCAEQTARYRAQRERLTSRPHRNEEGKFRAAEVRWCVFDHRTGKVLTGEELRAAAQAVNL